MIVFEKVSRYALSDVTFSIPAGEAAGLIGTSGCGKTTLIKLACGLLSPEKGRVWTMGKDPIRYRGSYGADISVFMTGVPILESEDTVLTGFKLLAAVYRLPKELFEKNYAALSQKLGFAELSHCRVRDLSLGQKMRAELGAALISDPKLLLLDEPYVGLDENAKAALADIIQERSAAGMTTLITSHDMSGVSRLCSRILLLDNGRSAFCGSVEELRSRYMPANTMTVRFLGRIPDLDDLPLKRYTLSDSTLTLEYDSNHITAAEITALLMVQTELTGVDIHRPGLEDIIMMIGAENELYRSKERKQDF